TATAATTSSPSARIGSPAPDARSTCPKTKAIKLRISWACQGRLACEDVDVEGGLVAAAVDAQALVGVSGQGSFDGAGADPEPAGGHEVVQQPASDGPDQVDGGTGDHVGGLSDQIPAGLYRDGETGPVRINIAGIGGVGDRDPHDLVDRQQGVDFLGDQCQVARPQHPTTEQG